MTNKTTTPPSTGTKLPDSLTTVSCAYPPCGRTFYRSTGYVRLYEGVFHFYCRMVCVSSDLDRFHHETERKGTV